MGGATQDMFPFMSLPPELRELIYYYAATPFPPIDTASIANSPDRVVVPKVAQLSRATRTEALAVFYRNRPIQLSLHCDRNIERSISWINNCAPHAEFSSSIVFSGRLDMTGDFFHITIQCLNEEPQFQVTSRQAASDKSAYLCERIRSQVEEAVLGIARGNIVDTKGRLTSTDLAYIMDEVLDEASSRPSWPVGSNRSTTPMG